MPVPIAFHAKLVVEPAVHCSGSNDMRCGSLLGLRSAVRRQPSKNIRKFLEGRTELWTFKNVAAVPVTEDAGDLHGRRAGRLNGSTSAFSSRSGACPPFGLVGSYTGLFIGRVRRVPAFSA